MNKLKKYLPAQAQASLSAINPGGPRTLHFSADENKSYSSKKKKNSMVITDSDKVTVLYIVNHRSSWSMFSSKPFLHIMRASNNYYNSEIEIGTVTFHNLGRTELTIHGRTVFLDKPAAWISRERTFQSAAIGGTTLTWKYDSIWKETITCYNQTGQWLARYKPSKGGLLELASPAVDGALLDELVVTALGIVQEAKRREILTDSTDAASSSVAAVVGG